MKKGHLCLITIAFVTIISSCSKDPIINNDKNVGISRITYFPTIVLTGDKVIAVANGTSFSDPGVKATAGSSDVPVTTTGSVDTNVDGVYSLNYSATNADGYSSSAARTIIVYTTDAGAAANDLSGLYLRAATGVTATWTKVAPGVYQVQNPGGSTAGPDLMVYAFNPTGFTIHIPDQVANDGTSYSSTNETYNNTTPASYSWVIINPSYGTGVRTFVKQ
jgi:Domain of unknown function (DUF5011)